MGGVLEAETSRHHAGGARLRGVEGGGRIADQLHQAHPLHPRLPALPQDQLPKKGRNRTTALHACCFRLDRRHRKTVGVAMLVEVLVAEGAVAVAQCSVVCTNRDGVRRGGVVFYFAYYSYK